jgi:MoaA/NifB/PqqE/SkfB family radical SAM enzyme
MIPRTARGFVRRHTRKALGLDGRLPGGCSLAPDHVYLIPTLRCDLHCPYCFQRDMPPCPDALGITGWRDVLDQVKPMGSTVVVMGGELFLYRPIMDLLCSVKEAGLPLVIITNGTALARRADELMDMGLDGLYVSIDGPPDVHNRVRGHPRGYELATRGLARIIERRRSGRARLAKPYTQVFCTVSGYTVGRLLEHAAAVLALGVDRLVLNALVYYPPSEVAAQAEALRTRFGVHALSCPSIDDAETSDVDPAQLEDEIRTLGHNLPRGFLSIDPPDLGARPHVYLGHDAPPFRKRGCVSAYRDMWIYPNGDVTACVRMNELVMGNVRSERLEDIWNGARYRSFRHRLHLEGPMPVCGRCVR